MTTKFFVVSSLSILGWLAQAVSSGDNLRLQGPTTSSVDPDQQDEDVAFSPGFVLKSGDFEVFLLVDNSEIIGGAAGGKKTRRDITNKELKANGVRLNWKKKYLELKC